MKVFNADLLYSTLFLMGPMKQLKRMCDKTRALATTIMLVSKRCSDTFMCLSAQNNGGALRLTALAHSYSIHD